MWNLDYTGGSNRYQKFIHEVGGASHDGRFEDMQRYMRFISRHLLFE